MNPLFEQQWRKATPAQRKSVRKDAEMSARLTFPAFVERNLGRRGFDPIRRVGIRLGDSYSDVGHLEMLWRKGQENAGHLGIPLSASVKRYRALTPPDVRMKQGIDVIRVNASKRAKAHTRRVG